MNTMKSEREGMCQDLDTPGCTKDACVDWVYCKVRTGERRSVSSTGGEKGVKKARFDLIPVLPLYKVAELYAKGAEKYSDHNWRRGYEWSKSFAALMRHAWSYWNGENVDPETGITHMASVVFHAMALIQFAEDFPQYDDRPKGAAK